MITQNARCRILASLGLVQCLPASTGLVLLLSAVIGMLRISLNSDMIMLCSRLMRTGEGEKQRWVLHVLHACVDVCMRRSLDIYTHVVPCMHGHVYVFCVCTRHAIARCEFGTSFTIRTECMMCKIEACIASHNQTLVRACAQADCSQAKVTVPNSSLLLNS